MAHDVFICYSTKDKEIVFPLVDDLERCGIRCWIAPRDIKPGRRYPEEIVDAIQGCCVFILVYSSNSAQSLDVENEVSAAWKFKKPMIPFRIENIPISKFLEYYIGHYQWVDAYEPPLELQFRSLEESVKDLIKQNPVSAANESQDTTLKASSVMDVDPVNGNDKSITAAVGKQAQTGRAIGDKPGITRRLSDLMDLPHAPRWVIAGLIGGLLIGLTEFSATNGYRMLWSLNHLGLPLNPTEANDAYHLVGTMIGLLLPLYFVILPLIAGYVYYRFSSVPPGTTKDAVKATLRPNLIALIIVFFGSLWNGSSTLEIANVPATAVETATGLNMVAPLFTIPISTILSIASTIIFTALGSVMAFYLRAKMGTVGPWKSARGAAEKAGIRGGILFCVFLVLAIFAYDAMLAVNKMPTHPSNILGVDVSDPLFVLWYLILSSIGVFVPGITGYLAVRYLDSKMLTLKQVLFTASLAGAIMLIISLLITFTALFSVYISTAISTHNMNVKMVQGLEYEFIIIYVLPTLMATTLAGTAIGGIISSILRRQLSRDNKIIALGSIVLSLMLTLSYFIYWILFSNNRNSGPLQFSATWDIFNFLAIIWYPLILTYVVLLPLYISFVIFRRQDDHHIIKVNAFKTAIRSCTIYLGVGTVLTMGLMYGLFFILPTPFIGATNATDLLSRHLNGVTGLIFVAMILIVCVVAALICFTLNAAIFEKLQPWLGKHKPYRVLASKDVK